jgi:hypothetical protein
MELYGYPSLAELYISGEVILEDWMHILDRLFILHKFMEQYQCLAPHPANDCDESLTNNKNNCKFYDSVGKNDILWLYKGKTLDRIKHLKMQNVYWKRLMSLDTLSINERSYKNINCYDKIMLSRCEYLADTATFSIMHGDYCFSNILIDPSNFIFKMIDPRGRVKKTRSVFGDPRYDIAKLRHSVCGMYDFIVNGLYRLEEIQDAFHCEILIPDGYSAMPTLFDEYAQRYRFVVEDIRFIEGLLFLSMVPLHKDDFIRQKMLYLKAVLIFNEVFSGGDNE